jgi:hypothetical protein
MNKFFTLFLPLAILVGCMPNTYYDINDPFAYGMRWYDRGAYPYAIQYWEPLLEKGDCDAEYWMGAIYFMGQGKTRNDQTAMTLWTKAANANHPKAQLAMGDVYAQDPHSFHHCAHCNVNKDLVRAYVWYKLAERSAYYGQEKDLVTQAINSTRSQMSQEQIATGETTLAQWKPTPRACSPRHWW